MAKSNLIVGLDIGSTKVCCLVAQPKENETLEIIGLGMAPSEGLKSGVVVNIESTVESIQKAVEEAELMAGIEISRVFTGIAGNHIKGFNSHGLIIINDKEVKKKDVQRVIDNATAVAMPRDREIIHVIPQEYIIDDQGGIKEPVGMAGVRLEAKVHIVTGAVTSIQNVVKSCNKAGLEIEDVVLQQFASGEAVLSSDEKELGVALLDIGGGSTDIAIYYNGCIKFTSMIDLGGNHVTNDIAVGLRASRKEAEKIKTRYGCAYSALVKPDEKIEVDRISGKEPTILSRKILSEIIQPRVEEIFSIARQEIRKSGIEDLIASGIVLTGGASLLPGTQEVAEQVFELPVRIGSPSEMDGGLVEKVKNPMYSTAVGLILYGSKSMGDSMPDTQGMGGLFKKAMGWFQEFV